MTEGEGMIDQDRILDHERRLGQWEIVEEAVDGLQRAAFELQIGGLLGVNR